MKKKISIILAVLILSLAGATAYLNLKEQWEVDRSKIPAKVEESKGFQKWITNLKKKDFDIEADEFRLREDNEVFNTQWMKVYSMDTAGTTELLKMNLDKESEVKNAVFSPSGSEFVDYQPIVRDGYKPNEARLFGLREDKVIDAKVVDCSIRANCYFDRAFFLDNDSFVVTEISRTINKKDETAEVCTPEQMCEYSFKLHFVDLKKNKRWVYESKPFERVLSNIIGEL